MYKVTVLLLSAVFLDVDTTVDVVKTVVVDVLNAVIVVVLVL